MPGLDVRPCQGRKVGNPSIPCFTFCRRARADGSVFAVKWLNVEHQIEFPYLMENEANGLCHATYRKIPRVVKFEELVLLPSGEACVVLE